MYYERLDLIFKDNNLYEIFPEISITVLDRFIREQIKHGNKFISPYKFAHEHTITVKESIKFFIYFIGDNGIFDIVYYFDCSRPGCISSRIFVDIDENSENLVRCDECGKGYYYQTYINFIKVLFELKTEVTIPTVNFSVERRDPNSTIEALRGLPPHLKFESPSSPVTHDEGGDLGVYLEDLFEANVDLEGQAISSMLEKFKNRVMEIGKK